MTRIDIPAEIIVTAEQREAAAIEQAWAALRAERDRRIIATQWLVDRHRDEIEREAEPTLIEADYAALQDYRQALRDLPGSTDDPREPDWPEMPGA